ncbi:MAG TPA: nickel pincer cofactor biosynthesis protein LarB [Armatimonadota bacterium]|nr:nickel pincer cofactor biosynthesis protein LarB [Armatimonadota bacterium]
MDHRLHELLKQVKSGEATIEQALERLRHLPFEDLEFAKLDTHRALRKGFPEAIYSPGKTPAQIATLMQRLVEHGQTALATRASREVFEAVRAELPDAEYHEAARIIVLKEWGQAPISGEVGASPRGCVLVISAGTADQPVAEEAAVTAETMGCRVERLYDVGVAGIHRLLGHADKLATADAIVVVAGMEGALASVVGGLARAPVVAVPTSVGYGTAFGGVGALLTMLNSCAGGVAVVNIDNGYGAGYYAGLIASGAATETERP